MGTAIRRSTASCRATCALVAVNAGHDKELALKGCLMPKTRIMYIECKANGVTGRARIGRVTFSKTGKTLYYAGKMFERLTPCGYKCNYRDTQSGEHYWISGCKRDGNDGLYGGCNAEIDEDVRAEYWTVIRRQPEKVASSNANR